MKIQPRKANSPVLWIVRVVLVVAAIALFSNGSYLSGVVAGALLWGTFKAEEKNRAKTATSKRALHTAGSHNSGARTDDSSRQADVYRPGPPESARSASGPAQPNQSNDRMIMETPADPYDDSASRPAGTSGTSGHQWPSPEPSTPVGTPPRPGDPYDATPRIDDKPVREMARTNSEMLARSQESMNEMRSRIEAEAQKARTDAAEALAATISAAGIGPAGIGTATSEIDGPRIRETASSLPPLSGSGAARDLPWETPPTLGAYGAGLLAASDGLVEGFAGELARHGQVQVFRNVRLSDFGDKAPLVVTKGTRAVIVDVIDLPADALSWVSERGKSVLKGGTSRSDKPARIAETVAAWSRDNPDADFASVLTLTAGSPSTVTGESAETVNLLDSQDVVGTVVDWLAEAGTDAEVTEQLRGYLESRANRF